jgi:hypothetical protein
MSAKQGIAPDVDLIRLPIERHMAVRHARQTCRASQLKPRTFTPVSACRDANR